MKLVGVGGNVVLIFRDVEMACGIEGSENVPRGTLKRFQIIIFVYIVGTGLSDGEL